jgi:predicted amidohydrolase YtcJ
MKHSWLRSLIVVLGAFCCSAAATEASLILVNGKVWTENPAQPTAHAVALDGSRILAVGDNAAIRKLAGPTTRIIDLGGRLLLPGFNDSHVHVLLGGGSLISVHLGTANSQGEF